MCLFSRQLNSNQDETSEAKMAATTNEFPMYAQVQTHRENQSTANSSASNTTYANVPPAANTNANNIVYADLNLPPRA